MVFKSCTQLILIFKEIYLHVVDQNCLKTQGQISDILVLGVNLW